MTGFGSAPQVIKVNQPACIYVTFKEYSTDSIKKQFHWQIEDFQDEFITNSNGVNDIVFSTPGIKHIRVLITSNYPKFITNELQFVVNVKE